MRKFIKRLYQHAFISYPLYYKGEFIGWYQPKGALKEYKRLRQGY